MSASKTRGRAANKVRANDEDLERSKSLTDVLVQHVADAEPTVSVIELDADDTGIEPKTPFSEVPHALTATSEARPMRINQTQTKVQRPRPATAVSSGAREV